MVAYSLGSHGGPGQEVYLDSNALLRLAWPPGPPGGQVINPPWKQLYLWGGHPKRNLRNKNLDL